MPRPYNPPDVPDTHVSFRLGASWVVYPDRNLVVKEGREVGLEPKVMAVLLFLARRAGRVVSQAELLDSVWAGTVVHPKVLSRAISKLRKAFGDDRRAPSFIETIPKRGYRLIAPVEPASARAVLRRRSRHLKLILGGVLGLCIVALYLGLRPGRSPAPRAAAPWVRTPLTAYPGSERDPAYSPSGKEIAFSWDGPDQDNVDIYVRKRDGGVPLRLTEDEAVERSPAWSPDGRLVAFARHHDGGRSLHLVGAGGGPEREVLGAAADLVDAIAWSPDGATLAYADRARDGAPYGIYLLALDTGKTTRLTAPPANHLGDINPSFSPDGRRIAFIRTVREGVQYVYTIRLADRQAHPVTREGRPILDLAWAADGEALYFSTSTPGRDGIWQIPITGVASDRVLATDVPVIDLDAAPVDGALAYTTARPEVSLWQQRLPDGEASLHPLSSTQWNSNPALSPDGAWIAFASARTGNAEIWMCRRNGSDCVQVTHFEDRAAGAPCWSPDGQFLAFEVRLGTRTNLFLVDVLGGTPRPITFDRWNDRLPAWSPGGEAIYFTSDRTGGWEVWKTTPEAGPPTRITREGGFAVQDSPGDTLLYYTKYGRDGLWARSQRSGEERILTERLAARDWGSWAIVDGGLYYLDRLSAPTPRLVFFDPSTGAEHVELTATEGWAPDQRGLAVDPDSTWILFARAGPMATDIIEATLSSE